MRLCIFCLLTALKRQAPQFRTRGDPVRVECTVVQRLRLRLSMATLRLFDMFSSSFVCFILFVLDKKVNG